MPQPLRSIECPDGLVGLPEVDYRKVEVENCIFKLCLDIMVFQEGRDATSSWSAAKNSWLWQTAGFPKLLLTCRLDLFDNCMLGGKRDQRLCWANNVPEMMKLQRLCDGLHKHAPWVLSTFFRKASPEIIVEAEFCDILCDRALDCIIKNAVSRGQYPDAKSVTRAILDGRSVAL
jgi:hypothetical protein